MMFTLDQAQKAQQLLAPIIFKTDLAYSRSCSEWVGTSTYLKYENQQLTGSFKIRGALHKILSLSKDSPETVIAASAGNHAQGVAFGARHCGKKSVIVMPENTPLVKIQATQSYGAEVILHGPNWDESYEYARRLEQEKGYVFVHPFDDLDIILGQATIGLELMEQLPDLDSIVVSVGGGGLIAGIASVVKQINPSCRVYGVVSEEFPGMKNVFSGESIKSEFLHKTIADGIAVKHPNLSIFKNYIEPLVDGMAQISDNDVAEAIVFLLERTKSLVEGAGAISLAAATKAKEFGWNLGGKTCVVLCGGNIDLNLVAKVIDRGLISSGRIARLKLVTTDSPGQLQKITELVAKHGANILEVHHDRYNRELNIREALVELLVETRNQKHQEDIVKELLSKGFRVLGL